MKRKRMYSHTEFPFFNLENGQMFLYDGLYYMKIEPLDLRGRTIETSCNAVTLSNGKLRTFNDSDKVYLVTGVDIQQCLTHQCDLMYCKDSPLLVKRQEYNKAYGVQSEHISSEVIYAKKKDKIDKPRANKRCKKGVIVLNSNYKKNK